MAYLATLEGEETITLDDLFNVNDYLGVKYFGVDRWNKIKAFACALTESAANSPKMFFVSTLQNDNTKPSELSCELFGFNDVMGECAFGSTTWNALKCELDNSLLGLPSVTGALKKVGNAVKTVVTAPKKAVDALATKTPLKYLPGVRLTNKAYNTVLNPARDAIAATVKKTNDIYSTTVQKVVKATPLKYTPGAQLILKAEKAKEAAGVTSKGTAGVYKSEEQEIAEKRAAAEAAAKAASKASAVTTANRDAEKQKKELAQQAAAAEAAAVQAQQTAETTQQALNVMEQRVESKYLPIVMAGAFGLLALSILKK